MEDYIIREIDRLGEMLLLIARKMGLLDGDTPDYSLMDVKDEFGKAGCPIDLDEAKKQALLQDALAYLDGKRYFSFRLHSLSKEAKSAEVDANRVPISFHLQATHPEGLGTKAVKSGWENGDKIFVTFSGVPCPKYLKMTYENGIWVEKQMDEDFECALPLSEGDTGTMTAIYLPFAKDYTCYTDPYDGYAFVFSEIFMSYYLTAQLPFEVVDGEVSGSFDMKMPDGFVQFYIEDDEAEEGKAMLWEPHIIPCAVTGVEGDGVSINVVELDSGKPVPGFRYGNGYVFTGMLDGEARNNPVTYNFTRFMGSGNIETASTATPHTMKPSGTEGRAANITGLVWTEQDVREAVDLGLPSGNKWANVNMGAALPTDFGAYYAWGELTPKVTYWWKNYKWGGNRQSHVSKYCPSGKASYWDGEGAPDNIMLLDPADDAAIAGWGESWQIPSEDDYDELIAECTWTWQEGYEGTEIDGFLVENNGNSIFLPAAGYVFDFGCASGENYLGYYFSTSVAPSPSDCRTLYFINGDEKGTMNHSEPRYCGFPIRPVWKD